MSDLTDRMRTCAARIYSLNEDAATALVNADAADLLIEAADALEPAADPLGTPMALLEPLLQPPGAAPPSVKPAAGTWISGLDTLPPAPQLNPYRPAGACPKCDSRANKKVFRNGTELYVGCPVCGHIWPYGGRS
jgi:hypothetical protein